MKDLAIGSRMLAGETSGCKEVAKTALRLLIILSHLKAVLATSLYAEASPANMRDPITKSYRGPRHTGTTEIELRTPPRRQEPVDSRLEENFQRIRT